MEKSLSQKALYKVINRPKQLISYSTLRQAKSTFYTFYSIFKLTLKNDKLYVFNLWKAI
jgi:hypothetical protein